MTYIGLDTSQHERSGPTGGAPLPAGLYNGVITRTQLKDTKDKTGNYLEVEFDISFPPEYSNRKFWDRFNIINKSLDATRIGKEQLADLVKAAGLQTLGEDSELHGKEVAMILKVRPETKNPDGSVKFQASNECQKYWPVGTAMEDHDAWLKSSRKGSAAASPPKQSWGTKPAQESQASQPATQTKAAKPWQRKS